MNGIEGIYKNGVGIYAYKDKDFEHLCGNVSQVLR